MEREEKVRYYVIGLNRGTTSTCKSKAVGGFLSLVGSPREEISQNATKIGHNVPLHAKARSALSKLR